MITLYVLRGRKTHKRYVGITNDLSRRMHEHRTGNTIVGKSIGLEFDIILTELYPDHRQAREREQYLKSGIGREWLNTHFSGSGPASGG